MLEQNINTGMSGNPVCNHITSLTRSHAVFLTLLQLSILWLLHARRTVKTDMVADVALVVKGNAKLSVLHVCVLVSLPLSWCIFSPGNMGYIMGGLWSFIYRSLGRLHYASQCNLFGASKSWDQFRNQNFASSGLNLAHPETQAIWEGNWGEEKENFLWQVDYKKKKRCCLKLIGSLACIPGHPPPPHTHCASSYRFVKESRIIWIQMCISYPSYCYFWRTNFQCFPFTRSAPGKQNWQALSQKRLRALIWYSVGITLFIFYWRKKTPSQCTAGLWGVLISVMFHGEVLV